MSSGIAHFERGFRVSVVALSINVLTILLSCNQASASHSFEFSLPALTGLSPVDQLLDTRTRDMLTRLRDRRLNEHSTTLFANGSGSDLSDALARHARELNRLLPHAASFPTDERAIAIGKILREIYGALYSVENYRHRHDPKDEVDEAHLAESLNAMGYLGVTPEPAKDFPEGGVSLLRDEAADCHRIIMGLADDRENSKARRTIVIDRAGTVLRSIPDIAAADLRADGTLYGTSQRLSIRKVSPSNTIAWEILEKNGLVFWGHHEVTPGRDGDVLTLSRKVHQYHGRDVYFDEIVKLSAADGSVLWEWSVYDALEDIRPHYIPLPLDFDHRYQPRGTILGMPQRGEDGTFDSYHLNSLEVLPENPLSSIDEAFEAGNYLVSFRNIDLVAILRREDFRVVWSWGPGELDWQHGPRMMPETGNILIFDNGPHRGRSRVIEIEPVHREIVWEYSEPLFFSENRGMADRLPNGNTLISISNEGRAIEVTPDKRIVWEWKSPVAGAQGERGAFYRAMGVE